MAIQPPLPDLFLKSPKMLPEKKKIFSKCPQDGGYFLKGRGINKGNQVQATLRCLAPEF